jgi:succinate dehydrogenase/fumarate reductase flavoprotein subunit
VFLDFTRNPGPPAGAPPFSLDLLDPESYRYLEASQALQARPIERLSALNPPAIELFGSHGIDLARDRLEIEVCAQHCNGGLQGDLWWESNIRHLFAVGEVCATHGVRRPGGAALNAGQVGGIRAALLIARRYADPAPPIMEFSAAVGPRVDQFLTLARAMVAGAGRPSGMAPAEVVAAVRETMTHAAGPIRDPEVASQARAAAWDLSARARAELRVSAGKELPGAFQALDLCLTHAVILTAIDEYLKAGGRSRGGALVCDPGGDSACALLGEAWHYRLNEPDAMVNGKIQEIRLDESLQPHVQWVDVRPIPAQDTRFETVWDDYRHDRIIR